MDKKNLNRQRHKNCKGQPVKKTELKQLCGTEVKKINKTVKVMHAL